MIAIGPHRFIADRSGALYWPDEATLIVADLHLEKGSAFARRGVMLPPYDTSETLRRLGDAIARYKPARVIALGDSLHDRDAAARLSDQDRATLGNLQATCTWMWVTGNHDPEIGVELGGDVVEALTVGRVRLLHVPGAKGDAFEIAGHLHPAARVALDGAGMRRPCFVADGSRLILPAFGAFTGGLNVLDAAFAPLFAMDALKIWLLGQDGIYPMPRSRLRPD